MEWYKVIDRDIDRNTTHLTITIRRFLIIGRPLPQLVSYLDVQRCFRRLVCETMFYGDRLGPRSRAETLVLRAFG